MNPVMATSALPHRLGRSARPALPVLIEVPSMRALPDPSRVSRVRSAYRSEATHRLAFDRRPRRQTRRRLKREVKLAAWVLLACLPLCYMASRAWSERLAQIAAVELSRTANPADGRGGIDPGRSLAREVSRAVFEPAVVLMSIEPAQPGSKPQAEAPVIFPGYLLPEDSLEEMAHEGS